jgi:hypothetical protein
MPFKPTPAETVAALSYASGALTVVVSRLVARHPEIAREMESYFIDRLAHFEEHGAGYVAAECRSALHTFRLVRSRKPLDPPLLTDLPEGVSPLFPWGESEAA